MKHILIIGYGNPLRGDDGLGWHVAGKLRSALNSPAIEILAVHQLTPELMDPISRAGRVIFIDAAIGAVPGEIHQSLLEPQSDFAAAFSHHATPAALLAGALSLYGHAPPATLLTVTGADFSLGEDLSPAVDAQVEAVVHAALRLMD